VDELCGLYKGIWQVVQSVVASVYQPDPVSKTTSPRVF